VPSLIFRKGLDMKHAVAGMLADNYHSAIIERIKAEDFAYRAGRLTVHLAREFGFCYGVDRAVDYAYQTRERFPDRQVYLTGEIIHNPHVNEKLRAMGIRFLNDEGQALDQLRAEDGYTSVIHGKVWHEETQATASQTAGYGGKYLVVFDRAETDLVCEYIRNGGESGAFMSHFSKAASTGFDPDRYLQRIGLANQTTMLMTESLEMGEMIRQ